MNSFLASAERTGERYPAHVYREVFAYLDCGIPSKGFVRVRCASCRFEKLLPFSCKRRGFCPSCGGRRMNQVAAHLVENVLPKAGVRQWVLSFPFSVRYLLAYNPTLTTKVLRVYVRSVSRWYKVKAKALGIADPETGAITFIQRFGSAINLNVHFHTVFLDGVFFKNGNKYKFRALPPPTDPEVAEVVQKLSRRITSLLERNNVGQDSLAEDCLSNEDPLLAQCGAASIQSRIAVGERAGKRVRRVGVGASIGEIYKIGGRCAVCDGFSLHANVAIPGRARDKIEKLCRYIARPPISQERLTERPDGKLLYKLKSAYSDGTTHVLFDPVELVEKLIAIIPPPRANLLRYHGVLAPNSKIRSKIVPLKKDTKSKKISNSKNYRWAELMKRTFGVDVLKCPACGKNMKVTSTLLDDSVVKPFLRSLKQPEDPPQPSPARAPPEEESDFDFDQSNPQSDDGF